VLSPHHQGIEPGLRRRLPYPGRIFGDLNDRSSAISQFIDNNQVQVLKPESGNGPMCFYVGIDKDVS
jgi:tetrathionate reductase subunit B